MYIPFGSLHIPLKFPESCPASAATERAQSGSIPTERGFSGNCGTSTIRIVIWYRIYGIEHRVYGIDYRVYDRVYGM